jgi:hypothetical protein
MSHVLNYQGHYFRIELCEVDKAQLSGKEDVEYVAWCSDAFKDLRDLPRQALSRFVAEPFPTHAEALLHIQDWIKANWDSLRTKEAVESRGFIYTVWIFKGDSSPSTFDFSEFVDAKSFAKAAEKGVDITKVGITDRERPQYLAVWEKTI